MTSLPRLKQVEITTGSRLHFGPLSFLPVEGRHFGGIGVMIDKPGWRLRLTKCDSEGVTGPQSDRVQELLHRLQPQDSTNWNVASTRIEVLEHIPSHRGLGSGTQLALALGTGLSRLAVQSTSTEQIAHKFGRGRRSAIGIAGFDTGGFLVDAGQSAPDSMGAIACRVPYPEEWRFVLISPANESSPFSGNAERRAFQDLASMDDQTSGRLARLVLTEILPALTQANHEAFAQALEQYGRAVGEFFRPQQGGVFAHPQMASIAEMLKQVGYSGVAQSSWGPTLAVPLPSTSAATELMQWLLQLAPEKIDVAVVAARNCGCEIVER